MRLRYALHPGFKVFGVIARKVVHFQAVQRTVEACALIFVPDDLPSLRIFIVAEEGGRLAENATTQELFGVIELGEVLEAAVLHIDCLRLAWCHRFRPSALGVSMSVCPCRAI